MFAHRDIDPDVDDAFKGALVILQMLAAQSAQAAHYLEILTLLESAVTQQRQRLAAQARQRRGQYVNRIFSLKESPKTEGQGAGRRRSDISTPLSTTGGSLYPWMPQDTPVTVTPPAMDGSFLDWEGMELPLWDSFPFTEPGSSAL